MGRWNGRMKISGQSLGPIPLEMGEHKPALEIHVFAASTMSVDSINQAMENQPVRISKPGTPSFNGPEDGASQAGFGGEPEL